MVNGQANINGSSVTGNWATEETLEELLKAFKGTSPAGKKKEKETEESAGRLHQLSQKAKKAKESIEDFGSSAKNAARSLGGIEDSAESVTSGLLGIVGGLGAVGAAAGFAAATFDSFVDAQVSAIQSGFSFSDQLIEARLELAAMGLNFTQFSTILANNGESLRNLGQNGTEAAHRFQQMVSSARDATAAMGYYGLTSEEIANEMADLTGILVRSGKVADDLFGSAVDSFSILNREVLGYARLTGRQSREIQRNRNVVDTDALFMSAMGALGDGAITSALTLTDAVTGTFDNAGAGIIEMVKKTILLAQTGIETRTADEIAALEMTGLGPVMDRFAQDFITGAGDPDQFARRIQSFVTEFGNQLATQEDRIRQQTILFQSGGGGPMQEEFNLFMTAITDSRTALRSLNDTPTAVEAFTAGLDDTTKQLLQFKTDLQAVLQNVRGGILALFGVDDFSALNSINLAAVGEDLNSMIRTLNEVKDFWFGDDGPAMTSMVAGIAALWLAPSVITGMVAGIASLWTSRAVVAALAGRLASGAAGAAGSAAAGAAGAAGTGRGLGASIGALAKNAGKFGKATAAISMLIGGLSAQFDQELDDSGMNALEKFNTGAVSGLLSGADFLANSVNSLLGLDEVLGEADLSGMFTQFQIDQERKVNELIARRDSERNARNTAQFPAWDLETARRRAESTMGQLDNMREAGTLDPEAHAILTGRFNGSSPEDLRAYFERLATAMEENNRLMRRQTDTIEGSQ